MTPEASLAGDRKVGAENPDILSLTLGRGASPGDLELSQFLQYGMAAVPKPNIYQCRHKTECVTGSGAGNPQLVELAKELTERVHAPPCEYECLLHPGNTNAWAKVVGLLCEENDFVLVEEFTYPSAQALWIPLGIKAVPIPADADGLLAQDLRFTLQNWDEQKRGGPRPRLYVVSKLALTSYLTL